MKNADMPATPLPTSSLCGEDSGLTKREDFAKAAMQGLLAGGYCIDDAKNRMNDVPSEAINLADALLADLERTP